MRVTAVERHEAGIQLWRIAEDYKQFRSDLSDKEALKLAMLRNPDLAESYLGCPVRRDGVDEEEKAYRTRKARPTKPKARADTYQRISVGRRETAQRTPGSEHTVHICCRWTMTLPSASIPYGSRI
jgi:hypothetical protein